MATEFINAMAPIVICGILPVAIVWIVTNKLKNRDDKRAEVLMKAIESDKSIDTNKLAEALGNVSEPKSDILSKRLLRGLIFTFIGIALIIGALVIFSNGGFGDTPEFGVMSGAVLLALGISYLIVYRVGYRQKQKESARPAENKEAE